MAVTFQHKIVVRPGSVFCFGTISSVADEEGSLHRIANPPERKSSSKISEKIRAGQEKAQPPALRAKTTFSKLGAEVPPSSKENEKKLVAVAVPFYPDVLFIGRAESPPVSDDEPTAPGEEPPQRESRRRRNRRRNFRRHHEAEERDPAQPVSRDEVSEIGETPEERVFRERRNSRRRDRQQAQEQAEQEARQR
jgi:hypothetical protein